MEQTIFNECNLKEEEIDEISTRVKVFLLNSNNEFLLANSNGGCQLAGGHVEKNEELKNTVKREVQEETGIVLSSEEIYNPFYEI